MGINLRTGQPGHGKSYSAVRCIRDALEDGRWVVSNIQLADGWSLVFARSNPFRRLVPGRVARIAQEYEGRYLFVEDLTLLRRLVLPPCGRCRGCRKGPGCTRESRGLAVLDEAHRWLNNRLWDADETGQAKTKAEAMRRRLDVVWFFSTHRHRGWDIELITQDDANLDRQVRSLFETRTILKNMRKFKLFGVLPVVPVNVFVGVRHWHDNEKTRLGVETFLLNRKLARCYDTFGAGRYLADDPDSILLGQTLPAVGDGGRGVAAPHGVPARVARRTSPAPVLSAAPSILRVVTPLENAETPPLAPARFPTIERDSGASSGPDTA